MSTTSQLNAVLQALDQDEAGAISRLSEWLRIKSISTDPAFKGDVRAAAMWAAGHLRESGFDVQIHETGDIGPDGRGGGHPVVWATCGGAADYSGPRILFYGHYDVQPVDPEHLWESRPFEPTLRDGAGNSIGCDAASLKKDGARIVARGASDDKGQVLMFLEAMRAWKQVSGKTGGGVAFSILLEGEEESGSVNLERYLADHAAEMKRCGVCLISDTGMLSPTQPAITYGVRGLLYTEVTLHAANQDLHSGMWGGRAPNPNNELAKILSQLWDSRGRVTIPGFYDAVIPIHESERAAWKQLPYKASEALAKIGLPPEADEWGGQERGYTSMEREWARPTAEINGMYGGYTGKGAKTVIPAHASAKVSFRLVANQTPAAVREAFFSWLDQRTPPGCRWDKHEHSGGFPATVPTDSPFLKAARQAVQKAAGSPPVLIKTGGSIPVAGILKKMAGLDTIFMGFGLDDDRVHSPNEKFEIACYRLGAKAHAAFVAELLSGG